MAQYDKLINLGLLSQFLTKAKTIFAPKITASGILKGDGSGGVSAAEAGTDYAMPGLGLTGAKVGDLVRVNAVDSNGKPTSWKHVPLNEIRCNKNLLDNWYFVGGGSQLGDGVFPINQRGQTTYSGVGYGIDRWAHVKGVEQLTVENDCITISSTTNDEQYFQFFDNDKKIVDKQVTLSILTSDGLKYSTFVYTGSGVEGKTAYDGYEISLTSYSGKNGVRFEIYTDSIQVSIIAVKLELGSEQTLAHNEGTAENPVWVLNEIPDYDEELRKCQLYFERIKQKWGFIGIGHEETISRGVVFGTCHPKKQGKNYDTTNVLIGNAYVLDSVNQGNSLAVSRIAQFNVLPSGSFSANFYVNGSQLVADRPCRLQFRDGTSYIDISCEP